MQEEVMRVVDLQEEVMQVDLLEDLQVENLDQQEECSLEVCLEVYLSEMYLSEHQKDLLDQKVVCLLV